MNVTRLEKPKVTLITRGYHPSAHPRELISESELNPACWSASTAEAMALGLGFVKVISRFTAKNVTAVISVIAEIESQAQAAEAMP